MTPRIVCAIALSAFSVAAPAAADPVELAATLIGRPYVWGAEGPASFDCSGLTQFVFGEYGIDLPRRAITQSQVGDRVGRRLQRGDLLFFATDARRSLVTHVGIYEGNGVMIDASKRYGRVRRDDLSDDYWADRFMFARRLSDDSGSWQVSERAPQPPSPPSDRRRGRTRVAEGIAAIADVFLRRPRQ
jgi:cell wall-associated NlpC family hydrolase